MCQIQKIIICSIICLLFFTFCSVNAQALKESKTFVFGSAKISKGGTSISSNITYNDTLGYGFDFGTAKVISIKNDGFIATVPVYFSVKLQEGNYKIDITLGSKIQASETSIKAESRRLMLTKISVLKNEEIHKTIVVNVRTPIIHEEHRINTKEREKYYLNWDDKLTLEFLGNSAIKAVKITPIDTITTLFLAGDSTVTDQDLEPWASWGQFLTAYINDKAVVANYAASGASLSSFKSRRRFEKILACIKSGDYVFIEFGHNDQKRKGDGIGPWQSYTNLLNEFIKEVRKEGGLPILLTPAQRRFFDTNGKLNPTHGDYPEAMRTVAKKMQVPLIDITKITTTLYESWGDDISRNAFVQYPSNTFPGQGKALEDNTHFNNFGAHEIALCVIQEIKKSNLKLKEVLVPNITTYDATKPNQIQQWSLPMSQRFEPVKPDGN